jgi:WS/DGAT/MGAT family acyltransferase
MRRLTGLDAVFLYMETPTNHMHVGSTAIFDPTTVPGGYSFDKVKDVIASRLHLLPPFRRRLVSIPFELHHPLWIEDPDFDLDYHVRRAGLPKPGGLDELAELAGDFMGRPLDRNRPLWEMVVVEGLEHDHIAMLSKVHHAAIDGVSGAELMVNLLDFTAEPREVDPPDEEWHPDRVPSELERLAYAWASLARQPFRAARAARRTAEAALNIRRRNRAPGTIAPPAPFAAPRTSLNGSITAHRRVALTSVSLDDVKHVKNTFGTTVNDVVMALCAGALRRYLDDRGELPDDPLVAFVPISVRADNEKGAMGNRVAGMFTSLATNIDDPVARLRAINEITRSAKEQQDAIGADTLTDWAEFAAPALAARAARLYSRTNMADRHRPVFNVTISNVPGPAFPLYSAGARLLAYYPHGPIVEGGGLNITVMSYMGSMDFGLVACRETVPGVWDIAHALGDALDELTKAAAAAG